MISVVNLALDQPKKLELLEMDQRAVLTWSIMDW